MEVKLVDDGDPLHLTLPKGEEESRLVHDFFEKATELYPDWKMGDRTDLAMAMLAVVKKWAHENAMTNPALDPDGETYWALQYDVEPEALTEPLDE